jgi:hypothetical protein
LHFAFDAAIACDYLKGIINLQNFQQMYATASITAQVSSSAPLARVIGIISIIQENASRL